MIRASLIIPGTDGLSPVMIQLGLMIFRIKLMTGLNGGKVNWTASDEK
jgi:hypothetical protein